MKENNIDGHIVHINSIAGHKVHNFPELNIYQASKYAVTALTETLRLEMNSLGLKIKITVGRYFFSKHILELRQITLGNSRFSSGIKKLIPIYF